MKNTQKLQTELSFDPVIPLLGINPKELKARSQREICAPIFIAAVLFTVTKILNQPKGPLTDEWASECNGVLLISFKKEGNPAICYNMDELRTLD